MRLRRWLWGWRPWSSLRRRDDELDREIRSHLELETDEQQQA